MSAMLRHPDPPLSDGVITLRAKGRDDVDTLVAICQDPEISRWTRVPSPYTREDAEGWIAAAELDRQAGLGIDWLAVDEQGEVVASIAVQHIRPDEGVGEIGYWVAGPRARPRDRHPRGPARRRLGAARARAARRSS